MHISAAWLNDYLDRPATPEEQADLLTRAGFPIEASEEVATSAGPDTRLDVELTSNRGDCACHLGLAREVVALSDRTLRRPNVALQPAGPAAATLVRVTNREPERCPLYTARLIRGIKVGPSPPWLQDRLIARGDIPRNNVVDATNFVLFEWGQPTHVFDLAKLAGPEIIIRRANADEPFLPLGEGSAEIKLSNDDLVIADAERAVALAGVKGGALTAVTAQTADILIESATFAPLGVRNSSRRHQIASDSSFRFERGVAAAQVNPAADRLAALILEVAGGELCDGVVADGAPIPQQRTASMRLERCRALLGASISDDEMVAALDRLGFQPECCDGTARCTIPIDRLDIEREADLIEEVGRLYGHDRIPLKETIEIRVAPPQPNIAGKRAVHDAMVGMGYLEAVTHSLISEKAAQAFIPPGMKMIRVDDDRAGAEPVLRPSIVPSLLRVMAHNRAGGVRDVKLFETAATFARIGDDWLERINLAIVHPESSRDEGVRPLRGVIDRLVRLILGRDAAISVEATDRLPWFEAGAAIHVNGEMLGTFGLLAKSVTASFDLDERVLAAEIGLPAFFDRFPPVTQATALPSFPAIERDISAIVPEATTWARVESVIASLNLEHQEALEFVTVFRGKAIGSGRKSLTLRVRFRAPDRTLTHDAVDGQMQRLVTAIERELDAEIRK